MGPNDRFYELRVICGEDYPRLPPKIKFVSKINMNGVNQNNGEVDGNYFFKHWNNNTIQDALTFLRKEMETPGFKKLKQPEEFTTY